MASNSDFEKLLAKHVAAGKLTADEAKLLDNAPRFGLESREVLSYLAGLVALIGLARIFAGPLSHASAIAAAIVFGILGLVIGAGSFKLLSSPTWKSRLAEVLEIIALICEAIAVGIALTEVGAASELAVFLTAGGVASWAMVRRKRAVFSSAILLSPAVLISSVALCAVIDLPGTKNSLIIGVAAAGLIAIGTRPINLAAIPRIVGAITIVGCAIGWYQEFDGVLITLLTLVIAGAYFAWAIRTRWFVLVASSVATVFFGLSFLIGHVVHNEMIQGVLMLVAGAVTLAAVGVYARNRPSQQLPAAPTA